MQTKVSLLSQSELEQIHEATLEVLKDTGIIINSEDIVQHLVKKGAKANGNHVYFPREMVEEAISMINKKVIFGARDKSKELCLPKDIHTFNCTSGYSPFLYDIIGGERRRSTAKDLAKIATLCDTLDLVDFFWPIAMPTEETAPEMEEISALNTSMRNITKHVECSCASPGAAQWQVRIAEAIAGSSEELRKHPLFSAVASPTTPLAFEECTVQSYPIFAKAGIPVTPMNVPMAGTTAPATFAGTFVITNAEQLAVLIILKAYNPDAPMVYACDSGSANMKTGDMSYNNPDYDLFSIGCSEIARFYNMPNCSSHSGDEGRDYINIPSFWNGVMRVSVSQMTNTDTSIWIGSKDDALATSLWDIVLDCETLKYAMIYNKHLEVNRETLAIDAIKEVGPRGEFISSMHTFTHFREELNSLEPEDSFIFQGGDFKHTALEMAEKAIEQANVTPLEDGLLKELDGYMAKARSEFENK
ncbi:MAG: trimethylamine methyltransferase family protein [Clostridiales bacterium]